MTGNRIQRLTNSILLGAYTYDYIINLDCVELLLLFFQILKILCSVMPEAVAGIWMQLVNQIIIPFLKVT